MLVRKEAAPKSPLRSPVPAPDVDGIYPDLDPASYHTRKAEHAKMYGVVPDDEFWENAEVVPQPGSPPTFGNSGSTKGGPEATGTGTFQMSLTRNASVAGGNRRGSVRRRSSFVKPPTSPPPELVPQKPREHASNEVWSTAIRKVGGVRRASKYFSEVDSVDLRRSSLGIGDDLVRNMPPRLTQRLYDFTTARQSQGWKLLGNWLDAFEIVEEHVGKTQAVVERLAVSEQSQYNVATSLLEQLLTVVQTFAPGLETTVTAVRRQIYMALFVDSKRILANSLPLLDDIKDDVTEGNLHKRTASHGMGTWRDTASALTGEKKLFDGEEGQRAQGVLVRAISSSMEMWRTSFLRLVFRSWRQVRPRRVHDIDTQKEVGVLKGELDYYKRSKESKGKKLEILNAEIRTYANDIDSELKDLKQSLEDRNKTVKFLEDEKEMLERHIKDMEQKFKTEPGAQEAEQVKSELHKTLVQLRDVQRQSKNLRDELDEAQHNEERAKQEFIRMRAEVEEYDDILTRVNNGLHAKLLPVKELLHDFCDCGFGATYALGTWMSSLAESAKQSSGLQMQVSYDTEFNTPELLAPNYILVLHAINRDIATASEINILATETDLFERMRKVVRWIDQISRSLALAKSVSPRSEFTIDDLCGNAVNMHLMFTSTLFLLWSLSRIEPPQQVDEPIQRDLFCAFVEREVKSPNEWVATVKEGAGALQRFQTSMVSLMAYINSFVTSSLRTNVIAGIEPIVHKPDVELERKRAASLLITVATRCLGVDFLKSEEAWDSIQDIIESRAAELITVCRHYSVGNNSGELPRLVIPTTSAWRMVQDAHLSSRHLGRDTMRDTFNQMHSARVRLSPEDYAGSVTGMSSFTDTARPHKSAQSEVTMFEFVILLVRIAVHRFPDVKPDLAFKRVLTEHILRSAHSVDIHFFRETVARKDVQAVVEEHRQLLTNLFHGAIAQDVRLSAKGLMSVTQFTDVFVAAKVVDEQVTTQHLTGIYYDAQLIEEDKPLWMCYSEFVVAFVAVANIRYNSPFLPIALKVNKLVSGHFVGSHAPSAGGARLRRRGSMGPGSGRRGSIRHARKTSDGDSGGVKTPKDVMTPPDVFSMDPTPLASDDETQ